MAQFDLVIRNALIVDGTGSVPRAGSVGVKNGSIAAISGADDRAAELPAGLQEIDAAGRVLHRATLTPGHIGPSVPGAVVVWELVAGRLDGITVGETLVWDV